MKGSDFLIILSSQHFIGNTFTHTALRELNTDKSYLSQKEKAIFCLYQSSFQSWFSNRRHNTGFGDNTFPVIYAGLLSINFDFRNIIFPFVWAKYMYNWKVMRDCCKLSFPWPLVALSLTLLSIFVWLSQTGELVHRLNHPHHYPKPLT